MDKFQLIESNSDFLIDFLSYFQSLLKKYQFVFKQKLLI